MKLFVIATALLSLSACAEFAPGTKVVPAFPDDRYEMSQNRVPASPEAATLRQARS